jgi:hypothetical protein
MRYYFPFPRLSHFHLRYYYRLSFFLEAWVRARNRDGADGGGSSHSAHGLDDTVLREVREDASQQIFHTKFVIPYCLELKWRDDCIHSPVLLRAETQYLHPRHLPQEEIARSQLTDLTSLYTKIVYISADSEHF